MNDRWFVDDVYDELVAARNEFPDQETTVDLSGWCSILTEEVGEVARCLNERLLGDDSGTNRANLQTELVQVAAMAWRMHAAANVQWPIEEAS